LMKCAARDDAFACQSSALDRNSEGRRLKIGDNWSYAPPVKNFWLRHWARQPNMGRKSLRGSRIPKIHSNNAPQMI